MWVLWLKAALIAVFDGSDGKESPTLQETWVRFLGWEDPPEKEIATPPVFFPGEFHGQRSLVGYNPWGHKKAGYD